MCIGLRNRAYAVQGYRKWLIINKWANSEVQTLLSINATRKYDVILMQLTSFTALERVQFLEKVVSHNKSLKLSGLKVNVAAGFHSYQADVHCCTFLFLSQLLQSFIFSPQKTSFHMHLLLSDLNEKNVFCEIFLHQMV